LRLKGERAYKLTLPRLLVESKDLFFVKETGSDSGLELEKD